MKEETELKKILLELAQRIADGGAIDTDSVGKLFETVFALKAERLKSPPILSQNPTSDPVVSSSQIFRSSLTTNSTAAGTKKEEGEGIPVVYIRIDKVIRGRTGHGFEWFSLKHNDYVSSKPPICKCGVVEDLKSPFFGQPDKFRPQSSYAAVGPLIYVFGGLDIDNNRVESAEVSYIDTRNPRDGWKVCKNQMQKERTLSYPVTLDDGRVLLVGGFRAQDRPFAQMFNPKKDEWVALENYPNTLPNSLDLSGHMIVKEKEKTMVLIHGYNTPYLYTYNVSTDSWGTRWKDEFKTHYTSGALVKGIYYVVDVDSGPERVVLCGYKVSSQQAECLPVKILVEKDGKKWLPQPDCNWRMPCPKLLACGNNKLGMIWYDHCFHDESVTRLSYNWSIFEMKKEECNDGVLRLAAHPLSHVCYHVNGRTNLIDHVVPVYFYGDRPKSSTRVPQNNEKVGKQNKVVPVDSIKG